MEERPGEVSFTWMGVEAIRLVISRVGLIVLINLFRADQRCGKLGVVMKTLGPELSQSGSRSKSRGSVNLIFNREPELLQNF